MRPESRIIFWLSIGHFLNHIGNYLTSALLIYMQTDISLTQTERGLLGTIPLTMLIFLSSLMGWLADKHPQYRKTLIYLGIFGIAIFGFIMATANSFLELATGTVILGFALSTFHPIAFIYLNNLPNNDKNMGINAIAGNFGSALTPILSMIFAVTFDWRISFIIFSVLQIAGGVLFLIFFPNELSIDKTMDEIAINNGNLSDKEETLVFPKKSFVLLISLLILISVTRAPIFRSLSYFTTIVFSDAFHFTKVESSILSAIILGIGSIASYSGGAINNRKITQNHSSITQRIDFRVNMLLLSTGVTMILLVVLAFTPIIPVVVFLLYVTIAFFFFLGAAISPTIVREISGPDNIGSATGFIFTGATIAGALAPTIFGFLADEFGFSASFLFLAVTALACFLLLLTFSLFAKKVINTL